MIYTIVPEVCFIPKWNRNKKQPKDNQIKIFIEFPSGVDIATFYASDDKDTPVVSQFLLYVKRVENFQIETDGNIVDATPRDIVETKGLADLMAEIKLFYTDYVSINKKK